MTITGEQAGQLIEALAALEHDRWSGWERYREGAVNTTHHTGEWNMIRWRRQRETSYEDLSEGEKQADRSEVYKTLEVLRRFGVEVDYVGVVDP